MNKTMMAIFTVILGLISFWTFGNEVYAADNNVATQATSYVKDKVEYYFDGKDVYEIVGERIVNGVQKFIIRRASEEASKMVVIALEAAGVGATVAGAAEVTAFFVVAYTIGKGTEYVIEEYDIDGKLAKAVHVAYDEAGELVCFVLDGIKNADIPGKAVACKDFVIDKGGKLGTVAIDGLKFAGKGIVRAGSKVVGLVY